MIYRVEWQHLHPIWAEVEADSWDEAMKKARRGEFISGTVDSDPGKDIWVRGKIEEAHIQPKKMKKNLTNR